MRKNHPLIKLNDTYLARESKVFYKLEYKTFVIPETNVIKNIPYLDLHKKKNKYLESFIEYVTLFGLRFGHQI